MKFSAKALMAWGPRCLKAERMVSVSSGEMGGGKWVFLIFLLRIAFLINLFWVWLGRWLVLE